MNWKDETVLITGATGFVGHAVCKLFKETEATVLALGSKDCDLRDQSEVDALFENFLPEVVIHLAGKVGGILANKRFPADFYWDNLTMGANILHYSHLYGVSKVVVLAAGCGYPLNAPFPLKEEDFWNGLPQPESAPYSMSKKMMILQAQAYAEQHNLNTTVLLPSNLYGPHDNFHLRDSHVVPALIRKIVSAKENGDATVEVWGDGLATREFLHVDDCAAAILIAASSTSGIGPYNLGTGVETSINELVRVICEAVGYEGSVVFDDSKPTGQYRRLYDMTKFKEEFGYLPSITLERGIKDAVEWFIGAPDEEIRGK